MRKALFFAMAVLLLSGQLLAQTRTVTGKVTDDLGNPIFGASVYIKGTQTGTTTAEDGTFSLTVPQSAKLLLISAVGSTPIEVEVSENVNVSLSTLASELDEVVVVPYGTARRRTFTGSVASLGSTDISKQQISNLTRSLEGTLPGIQVTTGSGQPGAGSAIRIRGFGSINASSDPLYVVDGVPYGGDLNSINPADIETLSVLKDASSTALYGARGGNGVIMITTKKGKGKTKIDLTARYGMNSRGVPEYDVIRNPGQFLELYWETLKNEALHRDPPLSEAEAAQYATDNLIDKVGGYNPFNVPADQVIDPATGKLNSSAKLLYYDDWADAMFESRPRQEYNATISGSSDKTRYLFSLGFLDDKGYIVQSNFKRFTGRLNLDQQVTKWLSVGINGSYANSKQNTTQEGNTTYQNAFYFTRNIAPIYPVYLRDEDGNFVLDTKGNKLYDFGDGAMGTRVYAATENPRATLDLDIYRRVADNMSARGYAEIRIMPELKFTFNYGVDVLDRNSTDFQNSLYGNAAGANGRGTISSGRVTTTNINQLLNYNKTFGDNHDFEILVGHESYDFVSSSLSGSKENFLDPSNPNLGNGVRIQGAFSGSDENGIEGYFSQIRYNFKSKFLVSGSFRRDASSRFTPENRWGTFWSVGAGYVLTEEEFLKNVSFLNFLKLKSSYGLAGNEGLLFTDLTQNYYPYSDQFQVVNNNNDLGLQFYAKGNPNITWEKNQTFDAGIEFRIFNRVNGAIEYFRRKTYDLLFNRPLPVSTGNASYPDNVGDMVNNGFEFEVNADVIRTKQFRLNIGVNGTHYNNKITTLPEESKESGITPTNLFKYLEGKSIYDYFTWQYAGVDAANGESLWYTDEMVNGSPTGKKITTNDFNQATKYYIGKSAIPKLRGGINLAAEYKGFDLSVLTSYGIGGYVFDAPYQGLMYAGGGDVTTWSSDILNRWTPENTTSSIPRLEENNQNANATSDRWLIDGSYFNIRNIVLGYSFPGSLFSKHGVSSSRIFVLADNVWLKSKRKGLDPRQDFDGSVFNAYSPIRTISVGLNVSF